MEHDRDEGAFMTLVMTDDTPLSSSLLKFKRCLNLQTMRLVIRASVVYSAKVPPWKICFL